MDDLSLMEMLARKARADRLTGATLTLSHLTHALRRLLPPPGEMRDARLTVIQVLELIEALPLTMILEGRGPLKETTPSADTPPRKEDPSDASTGS